MNHCVLEVEVLQPPTLRYTQDNQTPIAEMEVSFEALRADDPPGHLKVVGWGNLAQDLQNRVQVGQRLMVEGRLRMSTLARQDGTKEKRAEFTLSRLHPIDNGSSKVSDPRPGAASSPRRPQPQTSPPETAKTKNPMQAGSDGDGAKWNSSPLIPDTDDIPF